jgi:multidrug efflux system membrane fusion protein
MLKFAQLKGKFFMQLWNNLNSNTRTALIILVAAVLWLMTGVLGSKHSVEETPTVRIPRVATQLFTPETYEQTLTLIGRTEAERKANIAAKVSDTVIKTPVVEGAQVKVGDTLLLLDTAARKEAVTASKATLVAAQKLVEAARKLHAEGFQSDVTLATREAEVATAEQNLATARENLANTHIRAPFNGLVERVHVEVGDFASTGTALIDLLGTDEFLVVGYVSQQDRNLVHEGKIATARLASGSTVKGTIRFVARDADAATKTYRTEIMVDGKKYPGIAAGMSAEIDIPAKSLTAHSIPHSALVLDDEGMIGVMLAVSDTAIFAGVEILADTPKTVWVTGLPEQAHIITRGQTAVKSGSKIDTAAPEVADE